MQRCMTVGDAIKALKLLPLEAKLHAWLPGSYLPVLAVMLYTKDGKAMMEVYVPEDAAIAERL